MQEIAAHLIDINSQKDEGLFIVRDQLELIDSFCDFSDIKQHYQQKYIEFRRISLALDELQKLDQNDDLDYLKFVYQELNSKTINTQHYVELEDKILKAHSLEINSRLINWQCELLALKRSIRSVAFVGRCPSKIF